MNKETTNPWQTLSIDTAYENPWIKVTHRDVLNPAGKPGIYGVVHFKNLAIGIIPLDQDFNTWLVGQYRYATQQYTWEIPEGGGPFGTDPLISAQRELVEETGIRAKKWTEIAQVQTSNSVTDERGKIFVAQDLEFGESAPEETEELIIKKVPFEEALELVMNNQITDSLSMIGLMKIKLMIEKGRL